MSTLRRPRTRLPLATVLALPLLLSWQPAHAATDPDFPREIPTPRGSLVVYEPQYESFSGDALKGRAALAIEVKGKEPVFGVSWFTARLATDRDAGTAT